MDKPPDDNNIPDDENPSDDGEENEFSMPEGFPGIPKDARKRKIKIKLAPSALDVKFSDNIGITLGPTHGILKFGVFHVETGEFVVHTQIAMTPQGIVSLTNALKKNIEQARKNKPGRGSSMN